MVSATIPNLLSSSKSYTRTTEPASEFSTGASSASAAPSSIARNAESNVGRGTVTICSPSNWMAAASLNAPNSPWNATRPVSGLWFVMTGSMTLRRSAPPPPHLREWAIIPHMSSKPSASERQVAPGRPQPSEYAPYYEKYVSLISATDILGALEGQRLVMSQLLAARSEREGNFRYAPDKWTLKEVVGHINDTERVFAYRALRISRGDQTPIEGFEQDDYVKNGNFSERTLTDLAEEFSHVRDATLALLR